MRYGIGVTDYVNWDAGAAGAAGTRGRGEAENRCVLRRVSVSPFLPFSASPRPRPRVAPSSALY